MSRVKDIKLKVIPSKIANAFIKKWHYSGKVVPNSQLHFGAFLDGRLHGVMSYGPPLDRRKVLPLVHTAKGQPCKWNEMIELNRMAFDNYLPKNSESRCISVSFKLMQKNTPHIKWIVSFADATECGDGTIYRASGFYLTQIKENITLWINSQTGEKRQNMQFFHTGTPSERKTDKWSKVPGYQLRYIYIIDKSCKLNCPDIPYSKIDEFNAGMYKGEKISYNKRNNMRQ